MSTGRELFDEDPEVLTWPTDSRGYSSTVTFYNAKRGTGLRELEVRRHFKRGKLFLTQYIVRYDQANGNKNTSHVSLAEAFDSAGRRPRITRANLRKHS